MPQDPSSGAYGPPESRGLPQRLAFLEIDESDRARLRALAGDGQ